MYNQPVYILSFTQNMMVVVMCFHVDMNKNVKLHINHEKYLKKAFLYIKRAHGQQSLFIRPFPFL